MQTMDFNRIYKDNYQMILNHVNVKINNRLDAEDITSEVFIKVSKHINNDPPQIGDFDPSKNIKFTTWLHKIADNTIIDHFRKGVKENCVNNVSDFVNSDGDEVFQFVSDSKANSDVEGVELRTKILKAIDKLKPQHKAMANYYFINELSYKEISDNYNIPMNTVKANINRVREMLQHELKGVRKAVMV